MSDQISKYPNSPLGNSHFETKTERLETPVKNQKLFIGIPVETTLQENRVALVPNSVKTLIANGHRIMVETNAGAKAKYSDQEYSEAGAEIVHSKEQLYEAHLIVKTSTPSKEEIDLLHEGQILISPLQMPMLTHDYLNVLKSKRVVAIAMEYMQADDGSFPIVRVLSEMVGLSAILTAAELLSSNSGSRGVLLGGVAGVPPPKVVILGAGVVGEVAARTAMGLGASVRVFDDNVYKLMRLQKNIGRHLHTSTLNHVYLEYQLLSADVVIGAVHSEEGRAPIIVTEEMVMKMKPGSVIIDVSIDQGGCFETSEMQTHEHPTFIKHEVIHYCVPNIASKVARTSSLAISNILTPILLKAGNSSNIENLFFNNSGLRHGIYTYKGSLTNEYLGKKFGIKYTSLELLMTSSY
jgi:alanine dehydrogenase